MLETSLKNQKFKDSEVEKNLVCSLYNILDYELRRKPVDEKLINLIITNNIETMRQLINNQISLIYERIECMNQNKTENRDPVRSEFFYTILYFFAKAGKREVIDIIFTLAKKLPDKEYNWLERNVERTLFKPENTLIKKFRKTIDNKIEEMIADKYSMIRERGIELENRKQYYLYQTDD